MNLTFRKSIIILVFILIIGGFLRVYRLDKMPFIADEFLGINISKGYAASNQWKTWDFNTNTLTDKTYTRAQVYYWQVGQVLKRLEPTEINARLVSVAWGMIGIILIFLIAYYFTQNYIIALIASTLLAISISALMFDRKLRMYSMFAPMYFTLSFFVYRFLESKPIEKLNIISPIKKLSEKTTLNWYCAIFAAIFFAISLATHLLTVNIAITIFIYLLIMAIRSRSVKNKYFILLALSAIAFLVSLNFSIFKTALAGFAFPVNHWSYLDKILLDYSHPIIAATFILLGAYYLIKKDMKSGLWLTLSFFVPLIMAIMFWARNAGDQYIYFTQPFKVILAGAGIYFVAEKISPKTFFLRKSKTIPFALITIYLILISINYSFFTSSRSFYIDSQKWDYPNYGQIFDYYLERRNENDILITRGMRKYYISGSGSNLLDYGGENQDYDRLTMERIKEAEGKYPRIWVIMSENDRDYMKGDAYHYIEDNYKKIETKYTENRIRIFLWERK